MVIGNGKNFFEKNDKDINQNININPKYILNEEQKDALDFLN